VKLDTITNPGTISYSFDQLNLISSCFAIQAIDSSGNASPLSPDYCVDNCPEFELPNIITLNDDGINDFFKAIRVRQIKEIDLYVYDRWGNLVYKTKDPYFQWNGNSIITKQRVSEGTLFYICDVFEPRVTGIKKRNLKGWVQVMK
jgi:gliding motility-associated-like protein